jgi:hypothetical protein
VGTALAFSVAACSRAQPPSEPTDATKVARGFIDALLSEDWEQASRFVDPEAWQAGIDEARRNRRIFLEWQARPSGEARWTTEPDWLGPHIEIPMEGDPPGEEHFRFTLIVEGSTSPDGRWVVYSYGTTDLDLEFGCVIGQGTPTPCPPSPVAS